RHVPNAKLGGFRLDYSTSKRLELGLSRSWFAGGEGQDNSVSNVIWDLYSEFFKPKAGAETKTDYRNQQIVFDFRIKIPEIKFIIYGELGREDHQMDWQDTIKNWDRTKAHIAGIKWIDFIDGYFILIEQADTVQPNKYSIPNTAWFNHFEYKNGWTYDDISIGHHLSADSRDMFVSFGYENPIQSWMIYFDQEVHGIRTIESDNNKEKKYEIGIKGFWNYLANQRLSYMIQKQLFDNFGGKPENKIESNTLRIGINYDI
ncbi:MAG: capsule assembly Wzi family protein, partial [Deltaproteobacteria bacterium]|nr:capsule assembly Wzi family protein [Deltaproteobacteria bacterium]